MIFQVILVPVGGGYHILCLGPMLTHTAVPEPTALGLGCACAPGCKLPRCGWAQRVIGWSALICADVAERRGLVVVIASHGFFLSVATVKTRELQVPEAFSYDLFYVLCAFF